jgi:hypothetical protein
MTEPPKAEWFQAQALQCIGLALQAKDPRIKRLYTLEAQRWLHLAELKTDHIIRDIAAAEYRGISTRHSASPPHSGQRLSRRLFGRLVRLPQQLRQPRDVDGDLRLARLGVAVARVDEGKRVAVGVADVVRRTAR